MLGQVTSRDNSQQDWVTGWVVGDFGLDEYPTFSWLDPRFGSNVNGSFCLAFWNEYSVETDVVNVNPVRRVDQGFFAAELDRTLVIVSHNLEVGGYRRAWLDY